VAHIGPSIDSCWLFYVQVLLLFFGTPALVYIRCPKPVSVGPYRAVRLEVLRLTVALTEAVASVWDLEMHYN
jgi:hypothetical protein